LQRRRRHTPRRAADQTLRIEYRDCLVSGSDDRLFDVDQPEVLEAGRYDNGLVSSLLSEGSGSGLCGDFSKAALVSVPSLPCCSCSVSMTLLASPTDLMQVQAILAVSRLSCMPSPVNAK
jgi:hypothetical protein